mmetsp:Transcript_332/g.380  ORF Transcript_332/g.380 Transcript_332/m.380 type:complete len:528 (+) Transcript_332:308-1891(+)
MMSTTATATLVLDVMVAVIALVVTISSNGVSAFSPTTTTTAYGIRKSNTVGHRVGGLQMSDNTDGGYVDINEQAPRNVGPFDEWATNCGVQRMENGFRLSPTNPNDQYNQDDISVVTDVDLSAGQPLLSIPANMILSSTNSRLELEEICDSFGDGSDSSGPGGTNDPGGIRTAVDLLQRLGAGDTVQKFYLFVKILLEYSNGMDSPYFPWLDSLPRLYYNSVSMTDFCYECLPPLVFQLSRRERVKFDNFYDALQKLDPRLFQGNDDVKTSKDTIVKWAFNVVHTRCFSGDRNGNSGNGNGIGEGGTGGEEQKIVPMADMFNHGTDTEVEVSYDDEGNCNVYTTRDIPAGSPLRLSYGCPTNPSEFFATYGFLDESSPATFCKIMNIPPTPELKTLGLDFSRMLFYKDTGDISSEVWDVVLYAKVLINDMETRQQFYDAHVTGDLETKNAIHQQYVGQTATELQTHVDMFLTQLEMLSAKGDDKDWQDHPRLPLILRHNDFVKATFEQVKLRLDPMVEELAQQQQQF